MPEPIFRCSKCGYDLRGNRNMRCPECGDPFTWESARQAALSFKNTRVKRFRNRAAIALWLWLGLVFIDLPASPLYGTLDRIENAPWATPAVRDICWLLLSPLWQMLFGLAATLLLAQRNRVAARVGRYCLCAWTTLAGAYLAASILTF